jgi:hypothetical protein
MYTPDTWVIVELSSDKGTHHRIMGGWYGGYAQGDQWRISSGVESIVDKGKLYEVPNTSGSVYLLHKQSEKLSFYTGQVLSSMAENTKDIKIKVVTIESILEQYGAKPKPKKSAKRVSRRVRSIPKGD